VAVIADGLRRARLLGALTIALAVPRCRSGASVGAAVAVEADVSTPSNDVGGPCADVSDLRVCWGGHGPPALVARTLPPFPAPTALGFRCLGNGSARACTPREASADAFACESMTCTQRHARQPDEGEWTCSDDDGIAVCVGGQPAAGVSSAGTDPGWICGDRRGAPDRLGRRVCVDLSPDFPDGHASGFRCHWSYDRGAARVCTRDVLAHVVGDPCDGSRPCVAGALCVAGRCLPPMPRPSCALDADCEGGACCFGSCVEARQ
jgi:hypothetical protein